MTLRPLRTRPSAVAAALLACLLLSVGCSSDDGGEDDDGAGDDTSAAPTDDGPAAPAEPAEPVVDPTAPLPFATLEAATADTPTTDECGAWEWGTNSTGADGATDFRQLDCYETPEEVGVGFPALLQTIMWAEFPDLGAATEYAAAQVLEDRQVLVAGPTVVSFGPQWSDRVDDLVAGLRTECGCGVLP